MLSIGNLYVWSYLYCLVLEGLIRVGDVFERDAVELSFVNVRNPVIFSSLTRRNGRFQVVLEAILRVSVRQFIALGKNSLFGTI